MTALAISDPEVCGYYPVNEQLYALQTTKQQFSLLLGQTRRILENNPKRTAFSVTGFWTELRINTVPITTSLPAGLHIRAGDTVLFTYRESGDFVRNEFYVRAIAGAANVVVTETELL
jgi:hypothetical protein